jgi:hypothetical protein
MAGTGSVITVSTRGRPAKFERMAKSRVDRDGVTRLAAQTSNGRQRRLLREVRDLLVANPGLEVAGPSDQGDGFTYVWVQSVGTRHAGVWGGPRGAAEEDPAGVQVEIIGGLQDVPETA